MKKAFNPKRALTTVLLASTMLVAPFFGRASEAKKNSVPTDTTELQISGFEIFKKIDPNTTVIKESDFAAILAANPRTQKIADRLGMSVEQFSKTQTRLSLREAKYRPPRKKKKAYDHQEYLIQVNAKSPVSSASGPWQFINSTRDLCASRENISVPKDWYKKPITVDVLQDQNTLQLSNFESNLDFADKFIAKLKKRGVSEFCINNNQGKACKVSISDKEFPVALVNMLHLTGTGNFNDMVESTGRYARENGKETFKMTSMCPAGYQDALWHFSAAYVESGSKIFESKSDYSLTGFPANSVYFDRPLARTIIHSSSTGSVSYNRSKREKKRLIIGQEEKPVTFDHVIAAVTLFNDQNAKAPADPVSKTPSQKNTLKRDMHAVLPPEDDHAEPKMPHAPEGGGSPPDMILPPAPQVVSAPAAPAVAESTRTDSTQRPVQTRQPVDTRFGEKHAGKQLRIDGIQYVVDDELLSKMAVLYGNNVKDVLDAAMENRHRNRFTKRDQFDANSVLAQAMHDTRDFGITAAYLLS